ncbi:hypothetical protein DJ521_07190, partial [Sulfolobus sp. E3]
EIIPLLYNLPPIFGYITLIASGYIAYRRRNLKTYSFAFSIFSEKNISDKELVKISKKVIKKKINKNDENNLIGSFLRKIIKK